MPHLRALRALRERLYLAIFPYLLGIMGHCGGKVKEKMGRLKIDYDRGVGRLRSVCVESNPRGIDELRGNLRALPAPSTILVNVPEYMKAWPEDCYTVQEQLAPNVETFTRPV